MGMEQERRNSVHCQRPLINTTILREYLLWFLSQNTLSSTVSSHSLELLDSSVFTRITGQPDCSLCLPRRGKKRIVAKTEELLPYP